MHASIPSVDSVRHRVAALAALLPAVIGAFGAGHAQAASGDSFLDEFDRIDTARWYVSDGWVNGDHQNCTWSKDAVTAEGGALRVGFKRSPNKLRQYICGEIQTQGVFGPGIYEVRLRTPSGSGLNANMFTYIGEVHKKPHDEIDFEFLTKDTSRVQLNSFVAGKGGNERLIALPEASDAGFSDYALVWEPGRLRWFVDGKLVGETEDRAKIPTNDSKIYLSLWGSDTLVDWMGPFRDPGEPIAMAVDRVSFTAFGKPCLFAASLACDPARLGVD